MKKKICVIFGGESTEYEVSLRSAYSVISNLDKSLYDFIWQENKYKIRNIEAKILG